MSWTAVVRVGPLQGQVVDNVQSFNFTQGRRKLTDVYRGGTGTITGRRPDLLPPIKIGDPVLISFNDNGVNTSQLFQFRVSNFRIEYGFTSSMDTWEIEIEDAFAFLGRGTVTHTVVNNDLVSTIADACCIQNFITLNQYGTTSSRSAAQTITNENALDVFQTALNTEQARAYAQGLTMEWYSRDYWQANLTNYFFSDNGTGQYTFNEIDYGTLADNYATQIVIQPRGGTQVLVSSGDFNYYLDSYSLNNQEAIYLGEWLLGSLSVDTPVVRSVSYLINSQTVTNPFAPLQSNSQVSVAFRGNSSIGVVEGFQLFATTSDIRVQLFVSESQYYQYLVLDDATFGTLDVNRLGW